MARDPGTQGDLTNLAPKVTRDIAADCAGQEATGDPGSKTNFGGLIPDFTGSLLSRDGGDFSPEASD